ncbi:hypothetical protein RKE29_25525 [Streptomyces sp. B1866]|uniref:hypothetical protein n=1 Tax=Streptomyces sp. B1866 TaxID=3075431 RepID=UPI002891694C|nr:hypothetical protein [Streptomyces sp. B1866]MDT3399947.1 hypothetical protein [Streptomyces sp. B1866]
MLTDVVCAALSAAGLGIAVMTAYRKRFLAATRKAAYALLPVGLALAGVVDWVRDLVFKPSVWVGIGLLGVSWLLFALTRAVEQRRAGVADGKQGDAVAPGASAPSLGAGGGAARPKRRGQRAGTGGGAEDFSDIEAILKRHGI